MSAKGTDLVNVSTTEGVTLYFLRRRSCPSFGTTRCAFLGVLHLWTSCDNFPTAIDPFSRCCILALFIHTLIPMLALRVIDVHGEAHGGVQILSDSDNPPGNLVGRCLCERLLLSVCSRPVSEHSNIHRSEVLIWDATKGNEQAA